MVDSIGHLHFVVHLVNACNNYTIYVSLSHSIGNGYYLLLLICLNFGTFV